MIPGYFNGGLKILGVYNQSFESNLNIFQFFIRNVRKIIDQYFISIYDQPLKKILRLKYEQEVPGHGLLKKITRESENFYREMPGSSIFIGVKAYFLKKLTSIGFPIPEGFVLTTELFRHKDIILRQPRMEQEFDLIVDQEIRELEKRSGLRFGSTKNPSLFSVRSGSAFSMPGAMYTFLNVGINRQRAGILSLQPKFSWAAWDCYHRFLQSMEISYGIEGDKFDHIMGSMNKNTELKKMFLHSAADAGNGG